MSRICICGHNEEDHTKNYSNEDVCGFHFCTFKLDNLRYLEEQCELIRQK